jgi:hypothetical protein
LPNQRKNIAVVQLANSVMIPVIRIVQIQALYQIAVHIIFFNASGRATGAQV